MKATTQDLGHLLFEYNTGGRDKYYKSLEVGDCGVRSICNATGKDYKEVYDTLNEIKSNWGSKATKGNLKIRNGSVRDGLEVVVMKEYLENRLGWEWTATCGVGTGFLLRLNNEELLPDKTYILRVSKHYTVYKHGVLIDTYDCSREGTRGVYGYWSPPKE